MSSESEPGAPDRRLRLREAIGMRALAHPARLAAIQHLMQVGPATATELGDVVGLTPSAMSYHLRLLERAGMIETAPSRGDGRERVWRSIHEGLDLSQPDDDSADTRSASIDLIEALISAEDIDTRRWLARADEPGWLDSGHFLGAVVLMSPQELQEVVAKFSALLRPFKVRDRRGSEPADAVATRLFLRGIPMP